MGILGGNQGYYPGFPGVAKKTEKINQISLAAPPAGPIVRLLQWFFLLSPRTLTLNAVELSLGRAMPAV